MKLCDAKATIRENEPREAAQKERGNRQKNGPIQRSVTIGLTAVTWWKERKNPCLHQGQYGDLLLSAAERKEKIFRMPQTPYLTTYYSSNSLLMENVG